MIAQYKITATRKLLLCFLILANLFVASYVFYYRQFKSQFTKLIPASELAGNVVIKDRIAELSAKNQTQQITVALLTSASTNCATGKLVQMLEKFAGDSHNGKFVVFLPNQFSQQDVENFKTNFNLKLQVERADEEMAQQWLPISSKYEALGVVLLFDSGRISVLQDLKEIEKSLSGIQ